MDTALMRRFLAHKNHYTANAQAKLKQSAEKSRTRTPNPYSWVFDYTPGPDINSYTATFYTCGLCHLLKSLGIEEITPPCAATITLWPKNRTPCSPANTPSPPAGRIATAIIKRESETPSVPLCLKAPCEGGWFYCSAQRLPGRGAVGGAD